MPHSQGGGRTLWYSFWAAAFCKSLPLYLCSWGCGLLLQALLPNPSLASMSAGCKLEAVAFFYLPGTQLTEQHPLLEEKSRKVTSQPDLTRVGVFPCFTDPNHPLEKNPFSPSCLLTPSSCCLLAACMPPSLNCRKLGDSPTRLSSRGAGWPPPLLRCFTCRVGLARCKAAPPVRGGTPLPVLTLCVCCCPPLLQLGGQLRLRSDRIKPIPAQRHWHGRGQICFQQ